MRLASACVHVWMWCWIAYPLEHWTQMVCWELSEYVLLGAWWLRNQRDLRSL